MFDRVVGDIEELEVRTRLEAGEVGDGVVRDEELFEVVERGETGKGG